jgi:homoserine kinase
MLGGIKKSDNKFDSKILLIGDKIGNKIRVCGVNSIIDFATPIPIGGLGSSSSRIVLDQISNNQKESLFALIGV